MVEVDKAKIEELFVFYFEVEGDYQVNAEGQLEVSGHCIARSGLKFKNLPVNFANVSGEFDVAETGLTTLIGSPPSVSSMDCSRNNLKSLKGGPKFVERFRCLKNQLHTCADCFERVEELNVRLNPIQTLEGIPNIAQLSVTWNAGLSLLRLLRMREFDVYGNDEIDRILHEYHKGDITTRSDILACQRELIKAGYEGNAKW